MALYTFTVTGWYIWHTFPMMLPTSCENKTRNQLNTIRKAMGKHYKQTTLCFTFCFNDSTKATGTPDSPCPKTVGWPRTRPSGTPLWHHQPTQKPSSLHSSAGWAYLAVHEKPDGQGHIQPALRLDFAGFHTRSVGEAGIWSRDRKFPGAGQEWWYSSQPVTYVRGMKRP